MRAMRYHSYGDSSVLTLDEVPVPTPGPGQVGVEGRRRGVEPL